MNGFAYTILARSLISYHGKGSALAIAIGRDFKGWLSVALYAIAIPLAFVNERISLALYVLVAMIWFVPDRRIENKLPELNGGQEMTDA